MARHSRVSGIDELTVAGYKSIKDEQALRIAPLTLLAGVNSAGKSSLMQPLLLMKQTLESSYTTGPLLLDGPHVKFRNSTELLTQFRSRTSERLPVVFGVGQEGAKIEAIAKKRLKETVGKEFGELPPSVVSDTTLLCVDRDQLAVQFNLYEVAPYAAGAPEISIAHADAAPLVKGTVLEPFFR